MIVDLLLNFFYVFVQGIAFLISQLGDVVPNPSIAYAFSQMTGYYSALNSYLPVDTILLIVAFDLVFEGSYLAYKLIRWAYSKVPGIT